MGHQLVSGAVTAGKIRTRPETVRWRQQLDGPLVFTNGVFDILHPGHVGLLEAASDLGSALVVALNDDESVRALGKGRDRPLNAAGARAAVVAGLAAVDCVVFFSEDTPAGLIRELRPDVLVKGADYGRHEVPGADFVESIGGRLVLLPMIPGYSTTSIVERMREQS